MAKNASKKDTTETDKIAGLDVRDSPDPNIDPSEYNFDRERTLLAMNEPFLGQIGLCTTIQEDWKCKTAYVGMAKGSHTLVLGYNPDFMRQLTTVERQGVFKHELYHVLFLHVTERAMANGRYMRLWNVATDLAINSIICEKNQGALPDFTLLPGRAPKFCDDPKLSDLIKSFPPMQSSDWYMDKLQEFAEQNGMPQDGEGQIVVDFGEGNGDGSFDDHSGWGNLPGEVREVLREQIREAIENGMKNAQRTTSWGSVPSSVQELIQQMLKHEVDWKSVVRMFAGRCRSIERDSTVKRLNKKLPYAFPGVQRKTVARLLWAIDQSGSMADEDVQRGLGEGFACSREADIDVVNFDTEIDPASFHTVKRGKGFRWERTRCGGTDFNCVQRYVNDPRNRGKWTGVVIMTDGYADNLGRIVGAKVLWLVTPTGTMERVRPGDLAIQMSKDKKAKAKSK